MPSVGGAAPRSQLVVLILRRWLPLAAVLGVVAAVYAPTIHDYFGGDDFLVIGPVHNMGAWESMWKALIMRDNIPYWRPLVSPIYALEVHGFWLRPWAYHLIALGLHLINVTLLVLLATVLTGRRGVGLAAGLLFGIHPAHTTTVAQISSTVELLSVVWYFTTVLCAVKYVHGGRTPPPPDPLPRANAAREGDSGVRAVPRRWYYLSLAGFVLALLSKESTASAAGVVTVLFFLYVFLPHRRMRRFLVDIAPFWLLVIPYIALTYITDTDDPTGITRHMYHLGWHVGQNMWWFLARLTVPLEVGQGPHVSTAGHIGAACLLAVAVLGLAFGSRQLRFLVLWTGIALTPLALWRPELLLGRFTYQASAPFAVLLALGGAWVVDLSSSPSPKGEGSLLHRTLRQLGARPSPLAIARGVRGVGVLLGAILVLTPRTVSQNRDRTGEGEAYRVLVSALRRDLPSLPAGSEVVLVDGIWSGPFHALYLDAVADTLYGAGRIHVVNLEPSRPLPDAPDGTVVYLRYDGATLARIEP